jgi:hypothetical protein
MTRDERKENVTGQLDGPNAAALRPQVLAIQIWMYGLSMVLPIVGLIILSYYCQSLPGPFMQTFGPAAMAAMAAITIGGFFGFLFAIPRSQQIDQTDRSRSSPSPLVTNTNLEQISDWLTKILVGVTLIQLGNILRRLGDLVGVLATAFGEQASGATVMAAGILTYFPAFGFLAGYVATRSIVTVLFGLIYSTLADVIDERTEQQASLVASQVVKRMSPTLRTDGQEVSTATPEHKSSSQE